MSSLTQFLDTFTTFDCQLSKLLQPTASRIFGVLSPKCRLLQSAVRGRIYTSLPPPAPTGRQ